MHASLILLTALHLTAIGLHLLHGVHACTRVRHTSVPASTSTRTLANTDVWRDVGSWPMGQIKQQIYVVLHMAITTVICMSMGACVMQQEVRQSSLYIKVVPTKALQWTTYGGKREWIALFIEATPLLSVHHLAFLICAASPSWVIGPCPLEHQPQSRTGGCWPVLLTAISIHALATRAAPSCR